MSKKIDNDKLDAKKLRAEMLKELLPLGKSFLLWVILVVIIAWDYTSNQWFSMLFVDFTTYLTYGISKLFFIPAELLADGKSMVTTLEVNYKSLSINHYPMIVELECSAYHAYVALISLVAFSNWNVRTKLITGSILFGSLAVLNSLRIIMLGIVGHSFPEIFNMMHDYVWNILLVIIIWGMWELSNRRIRKKFLENEK